MRSTLGVNVRFTFESGRDTTTRYSEPPEFARCHPTLATNPVGVPSLPEPPTPPRRWLPTHPHPSAFGAIYVASATRRRDPPHPPALRPSQRRPRVHESERAASLSFWKRAHDHHRPGTARERDVARYPARRRRIRPRRRRCGRRGSVLSARRRGVERPRPTSGPTCRTGDELVRAVLTTLESPWATTFECPLRPRGDATTAAVVPACSPRDRGRPNLSRCSSGSVRAVRRRPVGARRAMAATGQGRDRPSRPPRRGVSRHGASRRTTPGRRRPSPAPHHPVRPERGNEPAVLELRGAVVARIERLRRTVALILLAGVMLVTRCRIGAWCCVRQ